MYIRLKGNSNNTNKFDEKMDYINIILKKWENRNLSLFGKIRILKTYALSQLTLPASTLCIPNYLVKKVEKIFYTFLWGKSEKVKRKKLIQKTSQGGLNMVDIQSYLDSLSATWITRIRESDPNVDQWAQLPNVFLKVINVNDIGLVLNFDNTVVFKEVENIPSFYRQAVVCFNAAFACDRTDFEESIMNQSLWGNKFITHNIKRKKNVLFLRNWIRSGVRNVKDLQFKDGILNVNQTYQQIILKQNIYCEIKLVKEALSPFKTIINQRNIKPSNLIRPIKSKVIYNLLKDKMLQGTKNANEIKYLTQFCTEEDICGAFNKKVLVEREIKLKEFNFKLLHGILPCNKNLKQWRIRPDESCDLCGIPQSIEHLIYSCIYIQPLWNFINSIFDLNIGYKQILGLDKQFNFDFVTTIVSFVIYKQWLLLSLENKKRCRKMLFPFFRTEILLRLEIYRLCKCVDTRNIVLLEELSERFSEM
jgi:hypothetical protein